MIEHRGRFKKNGLAFIDILDECFARLFHAEGTVKKKGEYVRYDIHIGNTEKGELMILQFCVRDHEDLASGFSNFVHISSILIPKNYRRQGIATRIIFLMSYVATREVKINLYVTSLTNDSWKESLISAGGEVDDDGDIQIFYQPFLDRFQDKLSYPVKII